MKREKAMARETHLLAPSNLDPRTVKWIRRAFITITILGWIALAWVAVQIASHVIQALLLLIIAALFAYALAPGVKFFERFMPRLLAILTVYLAVLGLITLFFYFAVITTIQQTREIAYTISQLLTPGRHGQPSPLEHLLSNYGIQHGQIINGLQQIENWAADFAKNSVAMIRGLLDIILDTLIVAVLSIYLLIDGSRVARWARHNAPAAARASFFLDTMQRIVGGYIRGQVTLAILIGLLVWAGMFFLFRLPYSVFLGFLAFIMAFIPVLGTLISGALCVMVGLTRGPLIAVLVLLYFAFIHVVESELVGPRIVGKAVGIHPVVSLFALVAGSELFGIWGALFASPIAGLLQAFIITFWTEWREAHPEYFSNNTAKLPNDFEKIVGTRFEQSAENTQK
jgi:predicted PurR-regulated permease PerM